MKFLSTLFIILGFAVLLLVAHYFIYDSLYVREEADKALRSVQGVDLVPSLGKQMNVEEVIHGIRTNAGNAAGDYQITLKMYDDGNRPADETRDVTMVSQWTWPQATAEERQKFSTLAQTPDLANIENGAKSQHCLFTGEVFPVTENIAEAKIPNLLIATSYAKLMIEKARQMEAEGRSADAERELLLAISFGNHLEGEYFLITSLVGLKIQSLALDALQPFYKRQGQNTKMDVSSRYAKEVARLTAEVRKLSSENTFGGLTLSVEGRKYLKRLFDSPNVLKSVKAEIAFRTSIQYTQFFTGRVYGPSSGSEAFLDELSQTDDPLLADITEKSKFFLRLPFRERWNLWPEAAVLK